MEGAASYVKDTELRLGLPGTDGAPAKPQASTATATLGSKRILPEDNEGTGRSGQEVPVAKAQVVGWPPIRSYRKNSFQERKVEAEASARLYVKVGMDGAPYLRKIDLKVYEGYKELSVGALDCMFKCFSPDLPGEVSIREGCNNGSDQYAITYEDKDGDLMLVGDVPWEMFISSCKRLWIMKGSEARGLESRQ